MEIKVCLLIVGIVEEKGGTWVSFLLLQSQHGACQKVLRVKASYCFQHMAYSFIFFFISQEAYSVFDMRLKLLAWRFSGR